MFDLAELSVSDLLECGSGLREAAEGSGSMEEAAERVVGYLYEHLLDKASFEPALALARLYKMHPLGQLPDDLADFARGAADRPAELRPDSPCLALLATTGVREEWREPSRSRRHRAIPLPSVEAFRSLPMVSRLVEEVGVDPLAVVSQDPELVREMDQRNYGVFYVPEATGSPHVPDQGFVTDSSIRSVLGFGGVLPSGSFFAVVMFSRVPIPAETAEAFSTIALAVKLSLLPHSGRRVFRSEPARPADPAWELALLSSKVTALEQLLAARQQVVSDQAVRLEQAARDAEDRAEALARSQAALAQEEARKSAILDAALDCVITMDDQGRVVEFNPAAERVFGYRSEEATGRVLAELIIPPALRARHRQGVARYLETGVSRILGGRVELEAMRSDGSVFPVELAITSVPGPGRPMFTGYLRDITARQRAERALLDSAERFANMAQTLQASLLPPVLPDIPGITLASLYRAAVEGTEVGGDFYDVFETGRGDWALTLGDVMGKGMEAAALTGLARYSLRAAAIRARRPEAVLAVLNEAIYRQHPDRFCTVAYARLRLEPRGVRLTLASGGHPPPLVITAAGRVQALETTGMLIGPFPSWEGKQRSTLLDRGDQIVFYSDGVLEARRGSEILGLEGLIQIVSEAAPRRAADTVALIEQTVAEYAGEAKDDMAVLVAAID